MKVLAKLFVLLFSLGLAGQAVAQTSLGTLFQGPGESKPSAASITAAKVNEMGTRDNRYRAADDFKVSDYSEFGSQPQYNLKPEMLSGYGLSTAEELKIAEGWNEMPNNISVLVRLNASAKVRHLGGRYYLDDCQWFIGGKWVQFYNRFKPVEVPASKAETRIEYRDRIVDKIVEVLGPERIVYRDREIPCVGCPKDLDANFGATWKSRLASAFWPPKNLARTTFSVASSFVIGYGIGGWGGKPAIMQGLRNAGYATAGTMVAAFWNPHRDKAEIMINGQKFSLQRGENSILTNYDPDVKAEWGADDKLRVFAKDSKGDWKLCYTAKPGQPANIVVVGTWKEPVAGAVKQQFGSLLNTTGRPKF